MTPEDGFATEMRNEGASGSRRAALTLHAMSPADRRWILARLAPSEQNALQVLLSELSDIGIPAQRDFVELAFSGSAMRPNSVAGGTEADLSRLLHELAAMSDVEIHEVLTPESDVLIARTLALAEFPWQRNLMARLGRERSREILTALASFQATPRLHGKATPYYVALAHVLFHKVRARPEFEQKSAKQRRARSSGLLELAASKFRLPAIRKWRKS